ncbi:hypothetical protein CON65_18380 [Bacillus pseudomycoides]|uniref:Uncharacterized protein n=1 Tax=Bacillus pseudomycoides TaxID=64104 RepID=A0AA91ZS69_9BACI|nr:hypothetical protein COO03_20895 [Bacillus sp. AFS098217]PED81189.1 hypothetical protein CON65_18380 [Bacillus pseudomycoides]PEU16510.1 hypothetical protein CN524_03985 [Bacillus sp. AFS019443]PEU21837.1 hypothetical protein CN525_01165 [Bacillus sp. AFS014408]PFW60692.1 hypothetical protein COL20_21020 [Bacillus sp. AFS075034]
MESLKILKVSICIFGILFVTNGIDFIAELLKDHTFNWLEFLCTIGFLFVLIKDSLDLKNKNYEK